MTDALQFEVKKDKWEQIQNGSYKLTVTMNPTDLTDNNDTLLLDFIKCAPGSRFVLAAVRITEDESPAVTKPAKPKQSWEDMPPSQQAGIRCNDPAFQEWCKEVATTTGWPWPVDPVNNGSATARWVREQCGAVSRTEFNEGEPFRKWLHLNSEYETDTGQQAEQR